MIEDIAKTVNNKPEAAMDENKLLLFDLGNIIFELDGVEAFWPELKSKPNLCQQLWASSRYVYELETGQISDFSQFYQLITRELDIRLNPIEFKQAFLAIIGRPFPGTEDMLSVLARDYRLMILSNTNKEHWQYCQKLLPLDKYIEKSFLSHEIGIMKPDKEIYESVLASVNAFPENIYYFDDKLENVNKAKEYGINAYESWGGSLIKQQLETLGFIHK